MNAVEYRRGLPERPTRILALPLNEKGGYSILAVCRQCANGNGRFSHHGFP